MPTFSGLFTVNRSRSRALTIDHTQVPSTQTDFPVLVNFTDTTFKTIANGGHVNNANGYDIIFTSDSGGSTRLKWEMEFYDPANGIITAWVKVGSVSSVSDTVFYMFYGGEINSDQSDPRNVWTNSFLNVYHFKNGTTLSVADSLAANNGTNHGATATTGQIDGGASFVSASSQYIDCGSVSGAAGMTLSAWVNATSFPNAYNTVGGRNSGSIQTILYVKSTGKLACYTTFGNYDGTGSHTLVAGTTYYLAMTISTAAGLTGYVNASSDHSGSGTDLNNVPVQMNIGQDALNAGRFWNGMIDEVRVCTAVRSSDWITCEYANQKPSSTFVSLGSEM